MRVLYERKITEREKREANSQSGSAAVSLTISATKFSGKSIDFVLQTMVHEHEFFTHISYKRVKP